MLFLLPKVRTMRKKIDLSPNCSRKNRHKSQIKFIIIHYTGMQSEIESFERLKDKSSKVSCHYFINRKGLIFQMVQDYKVAWHAGKSKWRTFNDLNANSIGIELVNKGHEFGYQNYSKAQLLSLITLCKNLKKKYSIKTENFLGHSDIAPLRKLDPGKKFPWKKLSKYGLGYWYINNKKKIKLNNKKNIKNLFFKNIYKIGYRYFKVGTRSKKDKLIIKSFQQHYFPLKVTGEIDIKTLKISHFLANKPEFT